MYFEVSRNYDPKLSALESSGGAIGLMAALTGLLTVPGQPRRDSSVASETGSSHSVASSVMTDDSMKKLIDSESLLVVETSQNGALK